MIFRFLSSRPIPDLLWSCSHWTRKWFHCHLNDKLDSWLCRVSSRRGWWPRYGCRSIWWFCPSKCQQRCPRLVLDCQPPEGCTPVPRLPCTSGCEPRLRAFRSFPCRIDRRRNPQNPRFCLSGYGYRHHYLCPRRWWSYLFYLDRFWMQGYRREEGRLPLLQRWILF